MSTVFADVLDTHLIMTYDKYHRLNVYLGLKASVFLHRIGLPYPILEMGKNLEQRVTKDCSDTDAMFIELWYSIEIEESFKNCEGDHNEVIDASKLNIVSETIYDAYLQGEVPIKQAIGEDENTEVVTKIYKEDEAVGREFVYMFTSNLCEHLRDDVKLPWGQLFNAMNITSCPIQPKDYKVEKMSMNLDHAQEMMNHEFVGCYYLVIQLLHMAESLAGIAPRELSCHTMAVCVEETKLEDE